MFNTYYQEETERIMNQKIPRIGVGVIIIKNNKVLLGKRLNSHGDGTWAFPGGHLEFNETWEECARRETLEETGISIKDIRFAHATNDIFFTEEKHYNTIFMLAHHESGEVKIMEPEKCEKWEWFFWKELPSPLFTPILNLLEAGYSPMN